MDYAQHRPGTQKCTKKTLLSKGSSWVSIPGISTLSARICTKQQVLSHLTGGPCGFTVHQVNSDSTNSVSSPVSHLSPRNCCHGNSHDTGDKDHLSWQPPGTGCASQGPPWLQAPFLLSQMPHPSLGLPSSANVTSPQGLSVTNLITRSPTLKGPQQWSSL
jgi:hypothetical protein